ncbi:MAG: hypothetical protein M1433_00160 [Candidatus Parvarchaeota archaeon]|nr:hypothetical protein [Candidatus Parvarchaeota archaeon]
MGIRVINVKSVYEELKKNKSVVNKITNLAKKGDIEGFTPPSTLIGEFNYPKVSVGIIFTTDQNASIYDAPKFWVKNGFDVLKIFGLRSSLVNAKNNVDVRRPGDSYMQNVALATMSETDLSIEMKISKVINRPMISKDLSPHGVTADLSMFKLNENVRINKNVEKVYYDKDLKAIEGMLYLYNNKIADDKISKILSVGAIGVKRRIVPTKWAITAVDDTVGKSMIEEIRSYPIGKEFAVKTGTVLGNHYLFLFIPDIWAFELLETWNRSGNEVFSGEGDYELYDGRKEYVKNTAGAYYAIRLAVLEKIKEMKQQFSVLVIREITPDYFAPLGVWVVREGARKVLSGEMNYFDNMEIAIKNVKDMLFYPINILGKSKVLQHRDRQTKLVGLI